MSEQRPASGIRRLLRVVVVILMVAGLREAMFRRNRATTPPGVRGS